MPTQVYIPTKTAVKVELQVSFLSMAFFIYIPSSKIAGSDGRSIFRVFFFFFNEFPYHSGKESARTESACNAGDLG